MHEGNFSKRWSLPVDEESPVAGAGGAGVAGGAGGAGGARVAGGAGGVPSHTTRYVIGVHRLVRELRHTFPHSTIVWRMMHPGLKHSITPRIVARLNAAVRAAAPAWRDRRPIERGRILNAIAAKIREKAAHLAAIESRQTGKPAWQSPLEVEVAAQYFEFYGGLTNLFQGEVIGLGAGYHSYTSREPFGVVGVITPWNAPINQAARGIAPALAAGNCVVAKPSEFTSASTVELARLACEECGLPPGVFNVVLGEGEACGAALVSHPLVRKVAFKK
jgi:delta 1-pyrroline-5-carboxylate dehydrogenase